MDQQHARLDEDALLAGHHGDELFVVHLEEGVEEEGVEEGVEEEEEGVEEEGGANLAVAVDIRLPDHLVHLLVGQLLPQVSHHLGQGTGEATKRYPKF